ncbi:hypothetical protein AA0481_1100 [Acetobacter orientalis NRIC 0481]|nr:hypothetical protein AA0481_1100 [Acetobacter orientalis NRIC 0481]
MLLQVNLHAAYINGNNALLAKQSYCFNGFCFAGVMVANASGVHSPWPCENGAVSVYFAAFNTAHGRKKAFGNMLATLNLLRGTDA